jgi:hypothetical protein
MKNSLKTTLQKSIKQFAITTQSERTIMYKLDPNEAKKAFTNGERIDQIGKYIGRFTQVEDITAKTGTRGVSFRFVSTSGQRADFNIYTVRENGDRLPDFQALMAIMTCLQLRDINPSAGRIKYWDMEQKKEVERDGKIFAELQSKDIGLLLETEDYEKTGGGIGTKMVLAGVFQAGTELTANEILSKETQPKQLEKMVARLRHRPAKSRASSPASAPKPGSHGSGFDDMDSDIPF